MFPEKPTNPTKANKQIFPKKRKEQKNKEAHSHHRVTPMTKHIVLVNPKSFRFIVHSLSTAVRHTGSAMLHLIFAGSPGVRAETVPDRLRRVFNSIEHTLDGDITNATLARQAGMSVEAFIRWFKARTGRTP